MVVYIFVKECEKVWHKIPSILSSKLALIVSLKKVTSIPLMVVVKNDNK